MAYIDIINRFQAMQDAANAANEKRYEEALALYGDIVEQYKPGGAFGTGFEAELGRQKTKTVAGQTQQLVSSGLYGTSVTAGLGQKFEEEVGMPARLKLEDIRMGRYAEAVGQKAGLIERREDTGPDYGMIAQLAAQAASTPTYQPTTPSTYGQYEPHPSASKMITRPRSVSQPTTRTGSKVSSAPSASWGTQPQSTYAADIVYGQGLSSSYQAPQLSYAQTAAQSISDVVYGGDSLQRAFAAPKTTPKKGTKFGPGYSFSGPKSIW